MRILLDMDDVLVNFQDGAALAWGVLPKELLPHWEKGCWSMIPALSKALGLQEPMTWQRFWDPISGKAEFWEQLETLPWTEELLDIVRSYTNDWWIVTAASSCEMSYVGKLRWLRNYFGQSFDRFIPTPKKYLLANRNTILIDDKKDNVRDFMDAGGCGLIFPRHHSANYVYVGMELEYTEHTLRDILSSAPG